jgi:hypothetical protein
MTTKLFRNELKTIKVEEFNKAYIRKMAKLFYGDPQSFFRDIVQPVDLYRKKGNIPSNIKAFEQTLNSRGYFKDGYSHYGKLGKSVLVPSGHTRYAIDVQALKNDESRLTIAQFDDSVNSNQAGHWVCSESFHIPDRFDGTKVAELGMKIVDLLPLLKDIKQTVLPMNKGKLEKATPLQTEVLKKILAEEFSPNLKIYRTYEEFAVYFTEAYGEQISFNIPVFASDKEMRKIVRDAIAEIKLLSRIKTIGHPTLNRLIEHAQDSLEKSKCASQPLTN